MNNHAGVLGPPNNPMLLRIKRQEWPSLPDAIKHDRDIALMTPGFTTAWWSRALHRDKDLLSRHRHALSDDLIPLAIENYNSITRDDAIALAQFPGVKPIRSKVQMVEDIRNGMTWEQASRVYRCTEMTVWKTLNYPLLSNPTMPDWFRALIPGA